MVLNNYTDKFISLSNLSKFWEGVASKISAVDAKFAGYYTKGDVDGIKSNLEQKIADDIATASSSLQGEISTAKSDLTGLINGVDAKFAGYYTKGEVDGMDSAVRTAFAAADSALKEELLGAIGDLKTIELSVVESLPAEGASNVIYLVEENKFSGNYVEWIYVNGAWERIGTTAADLSNYYTKGEIDGKVSALETAISDAQAAAESAASGALAAYKTEVSGEFSAVRGEITSAVSGAKSELNGEIAKKLDKSEFESTIAGYYTSAQADALLADKADKSSVYTKGEVDGFITGLGDTYYTESEIDGKISALNEEIAKKANSEGLLDNYYNKGEVDTAVGAVASDLAGLAETVEGIVTVGGEKNVIVGVQVNGSDLTPDADRKVNVDLSAYALSANVYTTTEVDGFVSDLEGAIGDHESAVETWAASITFATDGEIEAIFA